MHDAKSIVLFVVLLLAGIAAIQACIWIPIILWMRRRQRAAQARLTSEMLAENIIRPPEKAVYEGATAPGYPGVKNNGVIALSGRRLAFVTVTGKLIEIAAGEIRGVHEAKWFKGSRVGGKTHLIVEVHSGEVGFFVTDNAAWTSAIKSVTAQ